MPGRLSVTMKLSRKMTVLGALYFSQGLPYGFFVQALPVLLRKQGFSLEQIGLSSLLALPWGFKFLWSPAVDRYSSRAFGHRKSWIIPAQLLSVLTLLVLAFLKLRGSLAWALTFVLLSNLMTATQDIATDGLSLDLMLPQERGLANGLKVSAYRGGMIIGGGTLLWLYQWLDWRGAYLCMAALTLLATIPLLILKEPDTLHIDAKNARPFQFLTRPGSLRVLCLLITYKLGDAFSTGMLRPFFSDLGLSVADIGWLLGTVGFVAGLLGAFTGGALVNRLGRKRALVAFGMLQAASVAGYTYMSHARPGQLFLAAICACEHFASGMATATLFTCMMDWSSKETRATDFSIQASVVVLATLAASALSGPSAQRLGYTQHFALSTALACLSVWVVLRLFPAAPKEQDG